MPARYELLDQADLHDEHVAVPQVLMRVKLRSTTSVVQGSTMDVNGRARLLLRHNKLVMIMWYTDGSSVTLHRPNAAKT